jgi:hypothetical protein
MPSEPQQPVVSQFGKNVGLGGDVTVIVGARRSGVAICAGPDGNWIGSKYARGAPLRAGTGADAAVEEAAAAGSATMGACALAKDPTPNRKKLTATIQICMARTPLYNHKHHGRQIETTAIDRARRRRVGRRNQPLGNRLRTGAADTKRK